MAEQLSNEKEQTNQSQGTVEAEKVPNPEDKTPQIGEQAGLDPKAYQSLQSYFAGQIESKVKPLLAEIASLKEAKVAKNSDEKFKAHLSKEAQAFLDEGEKEEEVQRYTKAKESFRQDILRHQKEREDFEQEKETWANEKTEHGKQVTVATALRLMVDNLIPDEKSRGFLLKEAEALVQESEGNPKVMEALVKARSSTLRESLSAALVEKPQPHRPDRGRAAPGGGGKGRKPTLEELRESTPFETDKKVKSGEWVL